MSSRRISRKGFAIEIEVPEGLGDRLRAAVGRPPASVDPSREVVLHAPPPVRLEPRDPQRALDFLRDPTLQGDGAPSPKLLEYTAEAERKLAAATTLAEKVALTPWYHTIELPGGLVTPGSHDHRRLIGHMGFPADLTGMRCLDVATFDGFWAFELERRGADVVALDLPSTAGLDLPTGAHQIMIDEKLESPFGGGFALAREALGSEVTLYQRSVYDLSPEALGMFDLVFAGDVLLHLERPLEALRRIRSVTRGTLVLADRYDAELTGRPGRLIGYQGGWRGLEWWRPSLDALAQMVIDAGFTDVDIRGVYRLPRTGAKVDLLGWHRAIMHVT